MPEDVVENIEKTGYCVPTRNVEFNIAKARKGGAFGMATATITVKGMTCGGCVNSVTKALKGVNGVKEAHVDLQGQRATVTFDESKTEVKVLKEAVEDAGYDVE